MNLIDCDCKENRASDDWCLVCKEDFSREWEILKTEEEEQAMDAEFDARVAQGTI